MKRTALLLVCAVLALTAIVYWPVGGFQFVSIDDNVYVTLNPFLRGGLAWDQVGRAFTSTYAHFWHPVTLLSLMLDHAVAGMAPGAYHVTNLLLHLGATLLLFLALFRMTGAAARSALVAALFAIHPLHVESVAWVAERKDVLSTLFWMLTMWAWAEYGIRRRRHWYWLALVSFGLGLMAKPMLVTLPIALLLIDLWPLGRLSSESAWSGGPARLVRAWWPLVREKIPFLLLALGAGVAAVHAQGTAVASLEAVPPGARIANLLVASSTYLAKTVWPSGLSVYYPMPLDPPLWPAAASAGLLAAVTVASFRLRQRAPYLLVGWSWYLVTLLPVSGLVQVGSHAMADRYTYVPLLGVFVMVAWGIAAAVGPRRGRQWIAGVAAVAVVGALSVAARAQVATWRDSAAVWRHALEVSPQNYYAQHGMGSLLRDEGLAQEAVPYLEAAIRLNPRFPDAHNNLGQALESLGRADEAAIHYQEALRIAPDSPDTRNNLGALLLKGGRAEEAAGLFREAVAGLPDSAAAHDNLGQALAALGHHSEAAAEYGVALRLEPAFAAAHAHLGIALAAQGRGAEAEAEYRESIRLAPGIADTYNNLGAALAGRGEIGEAARQFEQALRLDPSQLQARVNLGIALAGQGALDAAISQFREAVRLYPNLEIAHLYLGGALGGIGKRDEAAAQFREALRINPGSEPARRSLDALAGRVPPPAR